MPLVPARILRNPVTGYVQVDDGGMGQPGPVGTSEPVDPRKPDIKYLRIPPGEQGTFVTLKLMKKIVLGPWGHRHPDVVLLARQITSKTSPGLKKDYEAMADAVFKFAKANVPYRLDPAGLEWLQTPVYTLWGDNGKPVPADCDDHAILIASLAMALGLQAAFRTVRGKGGGRWVHVYAVIGWTKAGKTTWKSADSTQRRSTLGWDPPEASANGMKTWVIDPTLEEDREWET